MESNNQDTLKKMFIGGLSCETTDESLKSFYEVWGEVVDCVVLKDKNTGRSKCFGFITYRDADMVDRCMAERPHVIDGKRVDPKRLMPRNDAQKTEVMQRVNKVFVGGIKTLNESEIQEYFSKFGNVNSVNMVTDKVTGKGRGFCFLTFDDTDSADKIVLLKYHTIKDVRVEVKKAVEHNQKTVTRGGMPGEGRPQGKRTGHNFGANNNSGDYAAMGYNSGLQFPSMAAMAFHGAIPNVGNGVVTPYAFGSGYGNSSGAGALKGAPRSHQRAGPYDRQSSSIPHANLPSMPFGNTNYDPYSSSYSVPNENIYSSVHGQSAGPVYSASFPNAYGYSNVNYGNAITNPQQPNSKTN